MSYFSRVILDASDYQASRLLRNISQNGYQEHQLLWQLFPEDKEASRDFLFRTEKKPLQRIFYLVSQRKPIAAPGWLVESKPYNPVITEGQMLAFTLRVNPTVSRKNDAGKRQRHDVVMNEKHEIDFSKLAHDKRPSVPDLIQKAGVKWLVSRGERHGFTVTNQALMVESYDQHRSNKKGNRGVIRYSTMDLTGVLHVTDVALFTESLFKGIGPAKAFGCGLMLVRKC